ncbi:hypothetical protein PC116_g1221 [Phytophthora cactorum]|nr:hypothetical protein C6341_g5112 [Phytophthora cactorum]KAG4251053.1 hypothetical protein PC116_g1221 [Phytophthora cactorum]
MSQEEEEEKSPIRFKSRGRHKGTKEVKPFVGGKWKA